MSTALDVSPGDGRTLRAEIADGDDRLLPVFWLHGSPGTGELPEPLLDVPGIRWVSYARPGYPGSTAVPDRTVAHAGRDIAAVADAFGLDRFAVLGYSGGGPGAMAAGALLGDRVVGVLTAASPAPHDAEGLDFLAGMYPGGRAELTAAAQGREALQARLAAAPDFDPEMFQPVDFQVLEGPWGWLGRTGEQGMSAGPDGFVDDDLALTRPWGFEVGAVTAPVLLLQGTIDEIIPAAHAHWLAAHLPAAELRLLPDLGHVSVLTHAIDGLHWLLDQA